MMKPGLFIIGAPKCGTTTIADWLNQHPEVFLPRGGQFEPNFFNRDHLDDHRLTEDEYARLFQPAGSQHRLVGEKSVWYLSSAEAVPNILEYNAEANFIVCVRNPIEMAHALHHHQLFDRLETLSDFKEAWNAQEERARNKRARATASTYLLYGETCKLGAQVKRLSDRVPGDRVHIVFMDDIKAAPQAVYAGLIGFLGLVPFTPEFRVVNEAKAPRSPLLSELTIKAGAAKRALGIRRGLGILDRIGGWNRKARKWQLDPEMTPILRDYFRDDVALLGQLTRRDLSHWLR